MDKQEQQKYIEENIGFILQEYREKNYGVKNPIMILHENKALVVKNISEVALLHDERAGIERQLKDLSEEEGLQLVQYLSQNQIDPIYAGLNYSQTDISNKLKKEL